MRQRALEAVIVLGFLALLFIGAGITGKGKACEVWKSVWEEDFPTTEWQRAHCEEYTVREIPREYNP